MSATAQEVLYKKELRNAAVEHSVKFQTPKRYVSRKGRDPNYDRMEPKSSKKQEKSLADYICFKMSYTISLLLK